MHLAHSGDDYRNLKKVARKSTFSQSGLHNYIDVNLAVRTCGYRIFLCFTADSGGEEQDDGLLD